MVLNTSRYEFRRWGTNYCPHPNSPITPFIPYANLLTCTHLPVHYNQHPFMLTFLLITINDHDLKIKFVHDVCIIFMNCLITIIFHHVLKFWRWIILCWQVLRAVAVAAQVILCMHDLPEIISPGLTCWAHRKISPHRCRLCAAVCISSSQFEGEGNSFLKW